MLSSPSYRIEKARLRYENLLISLSDEREIDQLVAFDDDNDMANPMELTNSFDENNDIIQQSSFLESKQDDFDNFKKVKSPVSDIKKTVTRRYVINSHQMDNMRKPVFKSPSNKKNESSKQRSPLASYASLHENDDIVLAQQSEIEMLKHELSALKMSSSEEILCLKNEKQNAAKCLEKEKKSFEAELCSAEKEIKKYKELYESTLKKLDINTAQLETAVKHIDRLTRRENLMRSKDTKLNLKKYFL